MSRCAASLVVLLGLWPWAAWAQVPAGPEFQVNTFTTDRQTRPTLALDASGNFVVVWSSYDQDGSDWGVFAQRFTAAGAPLGAEFQVNTFTTST